MELPRMEKRQFISLIASLFFVLGAFLNLRLSVSVTGVGTDFRVPDELKSLLSPFLQQEEQQQQQQQASLSSHPKKYVAQPNDDTFSACLLTMDDNQKLPEWLAYHYHALPLRYLVVAVDPNSQTSPTEIFDRWRSRGMMEIIEWTDSDLMKGPAEKKLFSETDARHNHRARQKLFYYFCLAHMQTRNRTWTGLFDSDEYVAINEAVVKDAQERIAQPGAVIRLLGEWAADSNGTAFSSPQLPDIEMRRTCRVIPRRQYSSKESDKNLTERMLPPGYNASDFVTMRFRYRTEKPHVRGGLGKSLVDLSRIPAGVFQEHKFIERGGVHRAVTNSCPHAYENYVLPLGIHHYSGTLESYLAREDARKNGANGDREFSVASWETRSLRSEGGADDEVRPWLQAFVNDVGEQDASVLLHGAGKIPDKFTKLSNGTDEKVGETVTSLTDAQGATKTPNTTMRSNETGTGKVA